MNLVRRFNLKDIKKYEEDTGNNVLDYFNDIKIANILDLISLGNGNCGQEKAAELLDNYLNSGKELLDAILEIKKELIGVGDNELENEGTNTFSIATYKTLTDLYDHYCMQLMSVGFGYSEFWDLSTKGMYKVFNSIYIKRQNDIQQSINISHTQAALIAQAIVGKLPKKPPQIKLYKEKVNEEDEDMVNKLQSIANKHAR